TPPQLRRRWWRTPVGRPADTLGEHGSRLVPVGTGVPGLRPRRRNALQRPLHTARLGNAPSSRQLLEPVERAERRLQLVVTPDGRWRRGGTAALPRAGRRGLLR